MDVRHISIREAFDRHAATYDQRFSSLALAQAIRQDVWRIADAAFAADCRLLDIGPGTGEDSIHFAQRGIHVTGVDIAPAMVSQIQRKAGIAGLTPRIDAFCGDIKDFDFQNRMFDGLFSNFGALNCVDEIGCLRDLSQRCLKPGSLAVFVTMGRLYPLETAVFLLKGEIRQAFRRLRRVPEVRVEGVRIPVHYYSPRHLRRALGPEFSLLRIVGLRSILPVPGLEHTAKFLPGRFLKPLDSVVTRCALTAAFSDHFISVWRYR